MKHFIYFYHCFFVSRLPDFISDEIGQSWKLSIISFCLLVSTIIIFVFVFVFTSTYIIKFSRYIIVETKGGKKYVIFSIEKFEGSLKKKYCISASINTIIYNSLFRLGLYHFQTRIYKRFHKDDLITWSYEIFSY